MSRSIVDIEDLRRVLREGAGEDPGRELGDDILDVTFSDLGYDSIALLETASRLTREYQVTVADDALVATSTPRDLLAAINGV